MKGPEIYRELVILTDERDRWEESIPFVSSLLSDGSVKIQAKALWLLGEMGLLFPSLCRKQFPLSPLSLRGKSRFSGNGRLMPSAGSAGAASV